MTVRRWTASTLAVGTQLGKRVVLIIDAPIASAEIQSAAHQTFDARANATTDRAHDVIAPVARGSLPGYGFAERT
jgi:hypothetical protein